MFDWPARMKTLTVLVAASAFDVGQPANIKPVTVAAIAEMCLVVMVRFLSGVSAFRLVTAD